MTDEQNADDLASEIRGTTNRLSQVAASAATHIVGAIAGVPAAFRSGTLMLGEFEDDTTAAIAAGSAVGFRVVLLSSFVFAVLLGPLLMALVTTYSDTRRR